LPDPLRISESGPPTRPALFIERSIPMKPMKMETVGEDNVLRLVVTVR
jgi:hypothetical protein